MFRPSKKNVTRRQFLNKSLTLGVSLGLTGITQPLSATDKPAADGYSKRSLELLGKYRAFDLHSHPGMFPSKGISSRYTNDDAVKKTVAEMLEGRLSGAFFSFVSDLKILRIGTDGPKAYRSFEPDEAWLDYQRQLKVFNDLMKVLPVEAATTVTDLDAPTPGKVAAFIACEGGDCIEAQPQRLQQMYADGVRSVQLVHYAQNLIGDMQTSAPKYNGLSEVGKEVVMEMNRLGMLVDVAHVSLKTVEDVLKISNSPVVLSHSQLKHGSSQHARLLSADHARQVADADGVIGMWPSGFGNANFSEFVDNTVRLVELVGADHVALGSDMDGNYKPVFDSYRQLPLWVEALLAKGLSEKEVAQIAAENVRRLLQTVLK